MTPDKIAPDIIKSMGSQMDLLFTLSVAICGGIIALLVQLSLHKTDPGRTPIKWKGVTFLIVTFISEGLSVFFGYFARCSITSNIPAIYRLPFSEIDNFTKAKFDGHCTLKWLFAIQFGTFMVGIIFLFILLCLNLKLVKE